MSKKRRVKRKRTTDTTSSPKQQTVPQQKVASPTTRRKSKSRKTQGKVSTRIPTKEELQEEYSYVIKDLRRVGILAALMFILLIAANIAFQNGVF